MFCQIELPTDCPSAETLRHGLSRSLRARRRNFFLGACRHADRARENQPLDLTAVLALICTVARQCTKCQL
jgi:hypothetical protein